MNSAALVGDGATVVEQDTGAAASQCTGVDRGPYTVADTESLATARDGTSRLVGELSTAVQVHAYGSAADVPGIINCPWRAIE